MNVPQRKVATLGLRTQVPLQQKAYDREGRHASQYHNLCDTQQVVAGTSPALPAVLTSVLSGNTFNYILL